MDKKGFHEHEHSKQFTASSVHTTHSLEKKASILKVPFIKFQLRLVFRGDF